MTSSTSELSTSAPGSHPHTPQGFVTSARRTVRNLPFGVLAWLFPGLVALVGGLLRFIRLGFPGTLVFDETYYVKDGWTLVHNGYESEWPEEPNPEFEAGNTDIFLDDPSYVVHPPLGKWLIGWGMQVFGADSPFAWRFSAALVGTLSILLLGYFAARLFRSVWIGTIAAGLLAFDGVHFTHSRTSLLDLFLMFFVLLGFGFLVLDREQARASLARRLAAGGHGGAHPGRGAGPGSGTARATGLPGLLDRLLPASFGPVLWWRPWRLAAGISLGCAMGVKWSGLYALAVFGLLAVFWDVSMRRAAGIRHPWLAALTKDAVPAFLMLVPVAFVTYVVCWTGWIVTSGGWDRTWAANNHGWWDFLPDWIPSLAHYHYTAYTFHVGLASEHPYMSNPWGWIVQWRPTSFYYESPQAGDPGCDFPGVDSCSAAILSVGNPVIWGLAPLAVLALIGLWLLRRDWRAGGILAGLLATWAPWFLYQERTIFTFYTIVMVPFVVLALAYCLGLLWGRAPAVGAGPAPGQGASGRDADSPAPRRFARWAPHLPVALVARRLVVGLVLVAVVGAFAFYYPIWTGHTIPYDAWRLRILNPTWI
ncbi:dolichyl-phosphate-mannose--protein mannosyltransferase [Brevibacterium samyangense]|uniref:Polyprenol-phosphate-mannose--protein mannosyltransferase n=1 Tax=Brevibacterium samyangense TaxID=366888 RepID=A0ABN2T857_9MICO